MKSLILIFISLLSLTVYANETEQQYDKQQCLNELIEQAKANTIRDLFFPSDAKLIENPQSNENIVMSVITINGVFIACSYSPSFFQLIDEANLDSNTPRFSSAGPYVFQQQEVESIDALEEESSFCISLYEGRQTIKTTTTTPLLSVEYNSNECE